MPALIQISSILNYFDKLNYQKIENFSQYLMALDMQADIQRFQAKLGELFQIRIGINTGSAIAGVIGMKKFIYDLWGDTVNVASRMESSGLPGKIQVTSQTYEQLKNQYKYIFEYRGEISVKGKGLMNTYWLERRNP